MYHGAEPGRDDGAKPGRFGGQYVQQRGTKFRKQANVTIRVPANQFLTALNQLQNMGTVEKPETSTART